MNILAHAYLAGTNEEIIIGNFIADFIKGNPAHPRHQLSIDVQRGVLVHRLIDSFTDSHPTIEELRKLVRPRCHKYAGVAIDVILDHFLAINFERIAQQSLADFVNQFYRLIGQVLESFPIPIQQLADSIIRHDWLTSYKSIDGIDRALKGLAQRTSFTSNLDTVVLELTDNYAFFSHAFNVFFPQLESYVAHLIVAKKGKE